MTYKFYCPKCNCELPDKVTECPNCKQQLDNVLYKAVSPVLYSDRKIASGVIQIIICLIFFAVSAALLRSNLVIIPIFGFGVGALFGISGGKSITGTRTGECPHCQGLIKSLAVVKYFTCPVCHKPVILHKKCFETPLYANDNDIAIFKDIGNFDDLKTTEDVNERLVQMISLDFKTNGWNRWDESIHRNPDQLKRLYRATVSADEIKLIQYNPTVGIAKFKGLGGYYLTSGERCSCPDYRKRLKPCKHMYKLAMLIQNYNEELKDDDSFIGSQSYDNVLGGLRFIIVGRNQATIKDFITRHSGMYGYFGWDEVSAIVLATDVMTNARAEAIARDIEIFSFEQLKNLFSTKEVEEENK